MNKFEKILIILIGVFLTQSSVIGNINFSLADPLLIIYCIYLILNNRKWLDSRIILLLSIFLSYLLILTLIITPLYWGITTPFLNIITEVVKLILLFGYFFIGVYITRSGEIKTLILSFTYTCLSIGLVGIFVNFIGGPLKSFFYFGEIRLKGLMNDPNYFAVLQLCALSVVSNLNINKVSKYIYSLILLGSIFLTGSKTAFVCLVIFFIINIFKFFKKLNKYNIVVYFTIIIVSSVILYLLKDFNLPSTINDSLSRIFSLLNNSQNAISDAGSDRKLAWITGLKIIQESMFLGTGIGNYLSIAGTKFNVHILAHNTYLQIVAEWGIFLGLLILSYILIKSLKMLFIGRLLTNSYLLEFIVYFLIGSLSISLNNSRILWLVIGWLYIADKLIKKRSSRGKI